MELEKMKRKTIQCLKEIRDEQGLTIERKDALLEGLIKEYLENQNKT